MEHAQRTRLFFLAILGSLILGDFAGCSGGNDSPGSSSSMVLADLPPLRQRARTIDDFLINYGSWGDSKIAIAKKHQLVVIHPKNGNVKRAQVAAIQQGGSLVLAYVSIGEDLRTRGITDDQLRQDPRFRGDGSAPRIDPRGHLPNGGGSLEGINPLGAPSTGGTGFASWYLDDNSVDRQGVGDGFPDRN